MHQIKGTNLVFIHIPKTAGQALKVAFSIKNQGPAHGMNTPLDRRYINGKFIRFCVVRNPVDRFVSVWRYNVAHSLRPGTVGLAKFLREFGLDKDVNDFARYLEEHRYDLMLHAHLRPQTWFTRLGQPHIILRHENIAKEIEIIRLLAPDHFQGLPEKNVANKMPEIEHLQTHLSRCSERFVVKFYSEDMTAFGY